MMSRAVVLGIVLMAVGLSSACETEASRRAEQVDTCLALIDSTGMTVMVGDEGATEVCGCTVDSLQVRFPDAAERWATYSSALEERFQRRGVIGLAADTAWLNSQGKEIGAFAAAQAKLFGKCTAQMIQTSVEGVVIP